MIIGPDKRKEGDDLPPSENISRPGSAAGVPIGLSSLRSENVCSVLATNVMFPREILAARVSYLYKTAEWPS